MRLPFTGSFPITQYFGNVFIDKNGKDVYAQWGLKGHNGIDFGTPTGTVIVAPHRGKVIEASYDVNGYGNYVKIESEEEGSVLAHLQSIDVKVGFLLAEGDRIGKSNNTGASTGAHLHWGYYRMPRNRGNGYNGFIDQLSYIKSLLEGVQNGVKTRYKVGDTIRPAVDIPVGAAPGKEDFSYGRVSAKAPAVITGIEILNIGVYYNIDQRSIGGGTGWVRAEYVDSAEPYKEPTPEPQKEDKQTDKVYTEEQYRAKIKEISDQADAEIIKAREERDQYKSQNERYYNALNTIREVADLTIAGEKKSSIPADMKPNSGDKTNTIFGLDWLMGLFTKGGALN